MPKKSGCLSGLQHVLKKTSRRLVKKTPKAIEKKPKKKPCKKNPNLSKVKKTPSEKLEDCCIDLGWAMLSAILISIVEEVKAEAVEEVLHLM